LFNAGASETIRGSKKAEKGYAAEGSWRNTEREKKIPSELK